MFTPWGLFDPVKGGGDGSNSGRLMISCKQTASRDCLSVFIIDYLTLRYVHLRLHVPYTDCLRTNTNTPLILVMPPAKTTKRGKENVAPKAKKVVEEDPLADGFDGVYTSGLVRC